MSRLSGMRLTPGNDLDLGILPGGSASLQFPREMRDKHLYVCGGTGTGKSKFLESLIRQGSGAGISASRRSASYSRTHTTTALSIIRASFTKAATSP